MATVSGAIEAGDGTGDAVYLWTPLLTRELEISIVPVEKTHIKSTSAFEMGGSSEKSHALSPRISFENVEMTGYAAVLITPILTPSGIIHSAHYKPLVDEIVNYFGIVSLPKSISTSQKLNRDAIDASMVRLIERVLKQRYLLICVCVCVCVVHVLFSYFVVLLFMLIVSGAKITIARYRTHGRNCR
jgi:hypothetical protein